MTVFAWLPSTRLVLWSCYGVFVLQIVLLLVGLFSRFQAICVFVWFVSFHHRHYMIFDAQDNLFRLLGFLLIFLPLGCSYSVDRALGRRGPAARGESTVHAVWALRLIQIQMCVVLLGAAWMKMTDPDWVNGTALYYVARLDTFSGRFPLPDVLFEQMWTVRLLTWSAVTAEALVPIAVWFQETRRIALVLALCLHLSLEYSMVTFLFQWLMIAGWLSFLEPQDLTDLKSLWGKLRA